MSYTVQSVKVAQADIPGPELYWMSCWDEWFTLWLQIVIVRGDGVVALVNTGPPADLSALNALWTTVLGQRAAMRRRDEELVAPALARHGVAPEDVTHVLLTPLQLYTTGNVTLFPNAQICLSKRGWVHFHTTHQHPHDVRWNSLSPDLLVHLVTDAWDRVRLLEDEDEVVPGLRTWFSGTHHRASICVEVDSTAGIVCISDSFFTYPNVEQDRLLGINESMYEALETNARVRRTADHIVPLYDPAVFDRYPGGLVTP
jgi:hypothetical protein